MHVASAKRPKPPREPDRRLRLQPSVSALKLRRLPDSSVRQRKMLSAKDWKP